MTRSDAFQSAIRTFEDIRYERKVKAQQAPPDLFSEPWEQPASVTDAWKAQALAALETAARTHRELTVADIDWPAASDGRARGAILREGTRRGWLRPLGWIPSGADRHGRPVRLFASTIDREDTTDAPE